MSQTVFKFKCEKNQAEEIINSFVKEYGFENRRNSEGKVYYRIQCNIDMITEYGCFEYDITEDNLTIIAYLNRGEQFKNIKVESKLMAGTWYKTILNELIKRLKNVSISVSDDNIDLDNDINAINDKNKKEIYSNGIREKIFVIFAILLAVISFFLL